MFSLKEWSDKVMALGNKKGLGSGLSSLLGEGLEAINNITTGLSDGKHLDLKINDITTNPFQPRTIIDDKALNSLVVSIKENGVLQPILVRPIENENVSYEIVAGERRWRASKLAGKTSIPAIVKNLTDIQSAEIAIIENLQRENLTPLEEASAYKKLIEEFKISQLEISNVLGKSQSYISNILRLFTVG